MEKRLRKYLLFMLIICAVLQLQAQTIKLDFQDLSKWNTINRKVEAVNEDGKKAVRFNEVPNEGFLILKGIEFSNGTIEFDVRGKNVIQQSFVGIAFHRQDEKTYDAVYFRPFNFSSPDTDRRSHSVQYTSMPNYPWEKLREKFPGKYENKVNPAPDPDSWFHVRIIVDGKKVAAFVNNAQLPSLQIEKLSNTTTGGLALWVGNNSGGSFANLSISANNK
jgi:hypothetical protein